MSYGDSEAELVVFSAKRNRLEVLVDEIQEDIESGGGEFIGPYKPPVVDSNQLREFLTHLQNPDSGGEKFDESYNWLFDVADSEENLEALATIAQNEQPVFARKFNISGGREIKLALSFQLPEEIFATAKVGKKTHQKGNGYDPYTWDPSADTVPSHPDGW